MPIEVPEPDPELYERAKTLAAQARAPAQCGRIRCGTAGWTDKTLIRPGLFYPRGTTSAESRLRFYASQFSLVEVDATYYTLLAPEITSRWVRDTPDDFVFDVKAHPVFTGHPVEVARLPSDLKEELTQLGFERRVYPARMPEAIVREMQDRFWASVEPLASAGKLGCVMLQFPPWFIADRGNARLIERIAETAPGAPLAVEFRHRSWLDPARRSRVTDLLGHYHLSYVCVDEPDVERGGVPDALIVSNPELVLVRFHGKNAAGWEKRGASVHERFDYVYAPEELAAWTSRIHELAGQARAVHAIFNNCVRDYAVIGAKGLSVLLDADRAESADPHALEPPGEGQT